MFAVFLPWIVGPEGSRAGIGEGDGVLVLGLAGGAYLLSQRGTRWAWILAGLGTAVAARDAARVLGATGVSVGFGLWLAVAGMGLATLLLLGQLIEEVRQAARQGKGHRR